jgi:predicted outer membrane protein
MRFRNLWGAMLTMGVTVVIAVVIHRSGVGQAGGSSALVPSGRSDQSAAGLNASTLVPMLHQMNRMGIDAGNMAQANGASQAVKEYGRKLEQDCRAADNELTDYSRAGGAAVDGPVPTRMRGYLEQAKQRMENLRSQRGAAFDRAFAQAMKEAHAKAIQLIDKTRPHLTDPKLKSLLDELEPTMRTHDESASNMLAEGVRDERGQL